jgi:FG-GAP repeat
MTWGQAPAGLRAAVRKTLGRPAVQAASAWTQQAALADPGGGTDVLFGFPVAISGSTVAVGAPGTTATSMKSKFNL